MKIKALSSGERPPERLDAVEILRVASCLGVIWFHIPNAPFREFGFSGLICFVLLSVYFQAKGAVKDGFPAYFTKKISRILPPWIFWLLVYGLLNVARGAGFLPYSGGVLGGILTGSWIGLWYLPFILIVSLPVYPLSRLALPQNRMIPFFACLGSGLVLLWLACVQNRFNGEPFLQWCHAAPAIPMALGIYHCSQMNDGRRHAGMAIAALSTVALCLYVREINFGLAVSYGLAVPSVSLALLCSCRFPGFLVNLGKLCLGVYLIHALAISILKRIGIVGEHTAFMFIMVAITSFSLVAMMRKNPWLSRVL